MWKKLKTNGQKNKNKRCYLLKLDSHNKFTHTLFEIENHFVSTTTTMTKVECAVLNWFDKHWNDQNMFMQSHNTHPAHTIRQFIINRNDKMLTNFTLQNKKQTTTTKTIVNRKEIQLPSRSILRKYIYHYAVAASSVQVFWEEKKEKWEQKYKIIKRETIVMAILQFFETHFNFRSCFVSCVKSQMNRKVSVCVFTNRWRLKTFRVESHIRHWLFVCM